MLEASPEAAAIKAAAKERTLKPRAALPSDVHGRAVNFVMHLSGDSSNEKLVLGQYRMQTGAYAGKSFRWLLSNDLGYAFYLWRETEKGPTSKFGSLNKAAQSNLESFCKYVGMFPRLAKMHRGMKGTLDAKAKADATGDEGLKILGFGKYGDMTWRDMASSIQPKHVDYCRWLLERDDIQPESSVDAFVGYLRRFNRAQAAGVGQRPVTDASAISGARTSAIAGDATIAKAVPSATVTSSDALDISTSLSSDTYHSKSFFHFMYQFDTRCFYLRKYIRATYKSSRFLTYTHTHTRRTYIAQIERTLLC